MHLSRIHCTTINNHLHYFPVVCLHALRGPTCPSASMSSPTAAAPPKPSFESPGAKANACATRRSPTSRSCRPTLSTGSGPSSRAARSSPASMTPSRSAGRWPTATSPPSSASPKSSASRASLDRKNTRHGKLALAAIRPDHRPRLEARHRAAARRPRASARSRRGHRQRDAGHARLAGWPPASYRGESRTAAAGRKRTGPLRRQLELRGRPALPALRTRSQPRWQEGEAADHLRASLQRRGMSGGRRCLLRQHQ